MPALPQTISTPADGRITSLATLLVLDGTEVMYIVSPGNAQTGNSYQVSVQTLSEFIASIILTTIVEVTSGATYDVQAGDGRVLVNKTVGSATSVVFPLASSMTFETGVLVKDLKGDADINNITISFTSGELCDGQATVVLSNPYAWTTINPKPGGGGWYMT